MVDRTYVSPLLTPSDLFFALNSSLKLSIESPEDLVHPKPEQVRRLYVELMTMCYGRPLAPVKLNAKVAKSLGDIAEELKSALSLFPMLRELLARIKSAVQLELRDLTAPNEERTRKIMSELVNFIRYRTDEELLLADTDEMRQLASEEAEVESLRSRIAALKAELADSKSRKDELEIPISARKQKIQELERDRKHMEEEKEALEAEIDALSERVPDDPEAMALRQQLAAAKARQMELQQLYMSLESAISHLQSVQQLFLEYQRHQVEVQTLQAAVSEKRAQLANVTMEIDELQVEIEVEKEKESPLILEIRTTESQIREEEESQKRIKQAIESMREEHEARMLQIASKQEQLLKVAEDCRARIDALSVQRLSAIYT